MSVEHPFDAVLAEIDPHTKRVTWDDLRTLPAGHSLGISLLVTQRATFVDATVRADAPGRVWLGRPKNAPPMPFAVLAPGDGPDGTADADAIGVEMCRCDTPRWNPLGLALIWHAGLEAVTGEIWNGFATQLSERTDEYCDTGIDLIVASFAGESRT